MRFFGGRKSVRQGVVANPLFQRITWERESRAGEEEEKEERRGGVEEGGAKKKTGPSSGV